MSTIYYLNANDFSQEGNHMSANIGGLTLIMFHSQRCTHCVNFIPVFKSLPNSIRGINFGLCSVDNANRDIIRMSQNSSTPIRAVPKFILYNDGLPYVEYSGQRSQQAILSFLQEITNKLNQKQSFTQRPLRSRQNMGGGMPSRPMTTNHQQQETHTNTSFKITPSTGVKEYETSYGRPYNTLNEMDFLEYENAYRKQMGGK